MELKASSEARRTFRSHIRRFNNPCLAWDDIEREQEGNNNTRPEKCRFGDES